MAATIATSGDELQPAPAANAGPSAEITERLQPRRLAADSVRFLGDAPGAPLGDNCSDRSQRTDDETELDERIAAYLADAPAEWGDDPQLDAERFLEWLTLESTTSPECDRAPTPRAPVTPSPMVELTAIRQRLSHARFQRRWSSGRALEPTLSTTSRLTATLNPIHVWATFEPGPGGNHSDCVRADVLFFPAGDTVQSVLVGVDAVALLRCLQRRGSCRVRNLLRAAGGDVHDSLEVLRQLCAVGAIALQ